MNIKEQSLNAWTVENENGVVLAWIERKSDSNKLYGIRFKYYEVRYTKNLGFGADDLSHDIESSFVAAKKQAVQTIDNWIKS